MSFHEEQVAIVGTRPRQQRGEATRRAILAAARDEFASKGYFGGSMRSVARALGIELAHVQHHFRDKETLWAAVLADVLGRQQQETDAVIAANLDRPPEEVLRAVIEALVRYAAEHPHFVALVSQARTSPFAGGAGAFRSELRGGLEQVVELIAAAQARGRFAAGDPTILFYQLVGAALRIFTAQADAAMVLGRSPTDPNVLREHLRTCISLFMPASGDAVAPPSLAGTAETTLASPVEERHPAMVYLVAQLDSLVGSTLTETLDEVGLTRSQMMTFVRVAAEHRPTAARISRLLHVTPQSAMMTIRALEERGLVRRQPRKGGRRVLPITLTAEGYAVLNRLRQAVGSIEADLTDCLSDRERTALNALLTRILQRKRPSALAEWSPLLSG